MNYTDLLLEDYLKEDHKIETYKGYELDFDNDYIDSWLEDGFDNISDVITISYNGKQVGSADSFSKARRWVDEYIDKNTDWKKKCLDLINMLYYEYSAAVFAGDATGDEEDGTTEEFLSNPNKYVAEYGMYPHSGSLQNMYKQEFEDTLEAMSYEYDEEEILKDLKKYERTGHI